MSCYRADQDRNVRVGLLPLAHLTLMILPVLHPASDEVVGTIHIGAIARMLSARATRTSSKIAQV